MLVHSFLHLADEGAPSSACRTGADARRVSFDCFGSAGRPIWIGSLERDRNSVERLSNGRAPHAARPPTVDAGRIALRWAAGALDPPIGLPA